MGTYTRNQYIFYRTPSFSRTPTIGQNQGVFGILSKIVRVTVIGHRSLNITSINEDINDIKVIEVTSTISSALPKMSYVIEFGFSFNDFRMLFISKSHLLWAQCLQSWILRRNVETMHAENVRLCQD